MADIKVSQFAQAVLAQLETAYDEKQKQAIKETAVIIKETDNVVREHITFNSREGGYVDSISTKKIIGEFRQWSYVWYVKKPDYRLTHLLERGHDMPNGTQSKAYPHIAFGNEYAVRKYEEMIGRVYGNG